MSVIYGNPIIDEGTLVICVSQSGETIDTLEALKYAKGLGARTLSIVNVRGSSIARESGNVIYTGILGPLITKNPEFSASLISEAAAKAGIAVNNELPRECIETEIRSSEYIKNFMKNKMK